MVEHLPRLHNYPQCDNQEKGRTREIPLHPTLQEELGLWRVKWPIPLQKRSHQSRHARRRRQDAACRLRTGWLQRRVHPFLPQISPYIRKRRRYPCAPYHGALGPQLDGNIATLSFMHRKAKTSGRHGVWLKLRDLARSCSRTISPPPRMREWSRNVAPKAGPGQ